MDANVCFPLHNENEAGCTKAERGDIPKIVEMIEYYVKIILLSEL